MGQFPFLGELPIKFNISIYQSIYNISILSFYNSHFKTTALEPFKQILLQKTTTKKVLSSCPGVFGLEVISPAKEGLVFPHGWYLRLLSDSHPFKGEPVQYVRSLIS